MLRRGVCEHGLSRCSACLIFFFATFLVWPLAVFINAEEIWSIYTVFSISVTLANANAAEWNQGKLVSWHTEELSGLSSYCWRLLLCILWENSMQLAASLLLCNTAAYMSEVMTSSERTWYMCMYIGRCFCDVGVVCFLVQTVETDNKEWSILQSS